MDQSPLKKIHLRYYAFFKEQAGLAEETVATTALTPRDLYHELQQKYSFHLPLDILRVAVNDEFVALTTPLHDKDRLVFVPPVCGG